MEENAKNKALSSEQHEALALMCSQRHNLHCNIDNAIRVESSDFSELTNYFNSDRDNSFQALAKIINQKIPLKIPDAEDLIDENDFYYFGSYSSYDKMKEKAYSQYEKINTKIEKFLSKIDKKYKTNYCPTGVLRQI